MPLLDKVKHKDIGFNADGSAIYTRGATNSLGQKAVNPQQPYGNDPSKTKFNTFKGTDPTNLLLSGASGGIVGAGGMLSSGGMFGNESTGDKAANLVTGSMLAEGSSTDKLLNMATGGLSGAAKSLFGGGKKGPVWQTQEDVLGARQYEAAKPKDAASLTSSALFNAKNGLGY
jgi:hypothetical protein